MRRLLVLATLLFAGVVYAAVTATPVFVQTPKLSQTQFTGATAPTTSSTLYTGGANGSKIKGIYVTTTDTVSHLVTISVGTSAHCSNSGNTSTCSVSVAVTVPASSGFANGTPPVNMMSPTNWPGLPIDSDGNAFLYLPTSSITLEALYATNLATSTNTVNIVVVAEDF